MMALPDVNEMLRDLGGSLFPLGFLRLFWRLRGDLSRRPTVARTRVPLMGVKEEFQASRLASRLAFMMIEHIRRDAVGMVSIAENIGSSINRVYRIYEQNLEHPHGPLAHANPLSVVER